MSPFDYNLAMYSVKTLPEFDLWLADLPDARVRAAITGRILRLAQGLFGDAKFSVAENVHELRIHLGAGWRVYFTQRGRRLVVVLAGGSKRTQKQDLQAAENLVKTLDIAEKDHDKTVH